MLGNDHLLPDYVPGQDRYEEIRGQFGSTVPAAPLLIGLTGKKRHGKNTAADALRPWGYEVWGFADELKQAALDLDPIIGGAVYRGVTQFYVLSDVVDEIGWEEAKARPEVRRILQKLGTDVVRARSESFWVQALERRWFAAGQPRVAIADLRFDNEAQWVRAHGGFVIEIVRPDLPDDGDTHASEAGVSEEFLDCRITNRGVEQLHKDVRDAVRTLTSRNKETRP